MEFSSAYSEGTHGHSGVRAVAWLCTALLAVTVLPVARADFIGYYEPSNFIFTDIIGETPGLGAPNGSADFPDATTLVLTGSNDGSGLEGTTDLTIPAGGDGIFRFHYSFENQVPTLEPFGFPYGGYLLGSTFFELSTALGGSGSVSVPVQAGELIGFRVGGDNIGGPGVLTITEFAAPVPEPGTFQFACLSAAVLAIIGYRRLTRRRSTRA